jgi:hypothetical protein
MAAHRLCGKAAAAAAEKKTAGGGMAALAKNVLHGCIYTGEKACNNDATGQLAWPIIWPGNQSAWRLI